MAPAGVHRVVSGAAVLLVGVDEDDRRRLSPAPGGIGVADMAANFHESLLAESGGAFAGRANRLSCARNSRTARRLLGVALTTISIARPSGAATLNFQCFARVMLM